MRAPADFEISRCSSDEDPLEANSCHPTVHHSMPPLTEARWRRGASDDLFAHLSCKPRQLVPTRASRNRRGYWTVRALASFVPPERDLQSTRVSIKIVNRRSETDR